MEGEKRRKRNLVVKRGEACRDRFPARSIRKIQVFKSEPE